MGTIRQSLARATVQVGERELMGMQQEPARAVRAYE